MTNLKNLVSDLKSKNKNTVEYCARKLINELKDIDQPEILFHIMENLLSIRDIIDIDILESIDISYYVEYIRDSENMLYSEEDLNFINSLFLKELDKPNSRYELDIIFGVNKFTSETRKYIKNSTSENIFSGTLVKIKERRNK